MNRHTDKVGIVIGIFGDLKEWTDRALRAAESVKRQTVTCPWVISWDDTLQKARNGGVELLVQECAEVGSEIEWLIFLDADDTLDPRYVEKMLRGTGDLRQPSTVGVYPDGSEDSVVVLIPPGRTLLEKNHLVIGSMIRASIFNAIGGFNDLPVLEDWDLWIRCARAGAQITACPDAVYRVGVNLDSRNQDTDLHNKTYLKIRERYK